MKGWATLTAELHERCLSDAERTTPSFAKEGSRPRPASAKVLRPCICFCALIAFLIVCCTSAMAAPVIAPADAAVKLPPFTRLQLKNGMTLLLMEKHEVPLISMTVMVKTGSVADPKGKEGLATATADLLKKGT